MKLQLLFNVQQELSSVDNTNEEFEILEKWIFMDR